MQYRPKHFKVYELVDPKTYKDRGIKAWELLDPKLLRLIDTLRETFGSATINDWKWGGKFKWSGLRTSECKIGAKYSQHRFGRAADLKFRHISPADIRKAIRKDKVYFQEMGVTCIENKTATWLHVDVRNCDPIKWVNP